MFDKIKMKSREGERKTFPSFRPSLFFGFSSFSEKKSEKVSQMIGVGVTVDCVTLLSSRESFEVIDRNVMSPTGLALNHCDEMANVTQFADAGSLDINLREKYVMKASNQVMNFQLVEFSLSEWSFHSSATLIDW